MTAKPWDQMSADEKANHLATLLQDFINHQNGANMRMSTRIKALEESLARIDTSPPKV